MSLIKKIIYPDQLEKKIHKILDENLISKYNYDGNHGKLPFKAFENINKIFASKTNINIHIHIRIYIIIY